MLKLIFGSALRAGLVKFFVQEADGPVSLAALNSRFKELGKKLQAELENLEEIGLITHQNQDGHTVWQLNQDFALLPEFKSLIYKSIMLLEKNLASELSRLRGLQLLILTGVFNGSDIPTDIFMVGALDKKAVEKLISKMSNEFQGNLRFTIFSKAEFTYRRSMTDKFVYQVLNINPIVVVNKLTK